MMPIYSTRVAKLLAASVFALAAATPAVGSCTRRPSRTPRLRWRSRARARFRSLEPELNSRATRGCQPDESLDPSNGNCVPTMTSIPTSNGDGTVAPIPTRTTTDTTSTTDTGEPADLVPNINGDPCTGYWESTVCLTEDAPAVQPHSTISSSP